MKPANKLIETGQSAISNGDIPLDPFAVDIFGGKTPVAESVLPEETLPFKPKPMKKSDWAKFLPRMSNREVEFSRTLQKIPDGLTEKALEIIINSIARYTFRQPQHIELPTLWVAESNLNEALGKLKKSPKVFFTLASQPNNSTAVIAINTDFAASIIDLILGGKGWQLDPLRSLSPIENAIMQFLMLNVLQEINTFLDAPALLLQNVSHELKLNFSPNERGAEIAVNLKLEEFSGIINLIAPQKFLLSLEKGQNPLLKKNTEHKSLSFFEKAIPHLDLRLQVGKTNLDGESLLFLEPNDIVLLDKSEIIWQDGNFKGKLQICVGRGKNFRLNGIVENSDEQINFKIEEIFSEETRRKFTPAKFKMDEKVNEITETAETNEPEISPSLGNVQVALRVEIAGNKISLRELQNLHSGQVIALGCRPTDPVRLVTDNSDEPVANGELIEIEGQLGVRLTKVFI